MGSRRSQALQVTKLVLVAFDVLAVVSAFYLSVTLRNYFFAYRGGVYTPTYKHVLFAAGLSFLIVLYFRNSYLYRHFGFVRSISHLETLTKAWIAFVGFFIVVSFFLRVQLFIEHRITVFIFAVLGWFFLYLARFEVSPAIIDWITKRREHGNRILVVGTRDDMRDLADHLSRSYPGAGRLIGYVSETAAEAQDRTAQPPLLGAVSALQAILEQHQVDEMFVNLARQDWHTIKEVLESADASRVLVRIALPHFGALQERVPILPEVHEDYVYLHVSTFTNVERTLKRFLDVVIGLGCMIFLTPFCLIIAALIKLDSPGPVFFRQKRVGQGQCLFDVFKFRTMKENSEVQHKEAVRHLVEKDEAYFREVTGKRSFYKITNEEAVTRMGRWLRRSSLDELPQLINVLRGEMSLVGPRPLPSYEVELLKPWQHLRHQVRPGMTGFWQVFGRSVVSHEDMILMDTYYVINWSLAMDFRILLRTMLVILVGRGAV